MQNPPFSRSVVLAPADCYTPLPPVPLHRPGTHMHDAAVSIHGDTAAIGEVAVPSHLQNLANHKMLPNKDDIQELLVYLTLLFIVLSWMLREIHLAFFAASNDPESSSSARRIMRPLG